MKQKRLPDALGLRLTRQALTDEDPPFWRTISIPPSFGSSTCTRRCSHQVTFEADRIVCSGHIRKHWPTFRS